MAYQICFFDIKIAFFFCHEKCDDYLLQPQTTNADKIIGNIFLGNNLELMLLLLP